MNDVNVNRYDASQVIIECARRYTARAAAAVMLSASIANIVLSSTATAATPTIDVTVKTPKALAEALATAAPGAVIRLAPGNYGVVTIKALKPKTTIRITSADSANPALLNELTVYDSNRVTVDTLKFDASKSERTFPIVVRDSKNVTLSGLTVVGEGWGPNPTAISGIIMRDSSNVTLANSRISRFWHGVTLLNVTNARVVGNQLFDLRTDGIRGGGISDSVIEGNVITDFHPIPTDHPDGIQLWSTDQKVSAWNVIIRDNLVVRGVGIPIQGIFIRDVVGNLPFQNFQIYGNLVAGSRYNGIAVLGVDGLDAHDNLVLAYPDRKSFLRVEDATKVTLTNNVAGKYALINAKSVTQVRNKVVESYEVADVKARVTAWAATRTNLISANQPLLQTILNRW